MKRWTLLLLALLVTTLASPAVFAAALPTQIRLLAGTFDPLHDNGIRANDDDDQDDDGNIDGSKFLPDLPNVPAPGGTRYYLVQFTGPIRPEWQEQVRATGAKLSRYVPELAFVTRMTPAQEPAVRALPFVRFVGMYKPEWRVEPKLLRQAVSLGLGPNPGIVLTAYPGESIAPVIALLRKEIPSVAVVKNDSSRGEVAIVRVAAADALTLLQLALDHEVVAWIELWREPNIFNNHSVWKGQSDDRTNGPTEAAAAAPREYPLSATIWARDILGTGQIVAVADSGLRDTSVFFRHQAAAPVSVTHQNIAAPGAITVDLTRRKVIAYNWLPGAVNGDHAGCSYHGTHVTGSVAGDSDANSSTATTAAYNPGDGMAPQAKLVFQDIGSGPTATTCSLGGIPGDYRDLFTQARNAGARIHSDSWGSATGAYGAGEQQLDDFAFTNEDFLINFAAGNDDAGMNKVGSPCLAKNTMCVGALTHGSAQSDGVPTWSNEGWTPGDQRYKPDISAPGENIVSANGASDTTTQTMSGTSMATPTASGYSALARQYFVDGWYPTGAKVPANAITPSSALLKATLISGTRPVPNHSAEFTAAPCGNPCQDSGWGRINLGDSLYFNGDTLKLREWDVPTSAGNETGLAQEYSIENVAAGTRLNIILAWPDAPGTLGAAAALTNNLNLEVIGPGGTTYRGNQWTGAGTNGTKKESTTAPAAWDTVNNVEGVQIAAPAAGNYLVRVHGFNVPGNGTTTRQGYAIAATGNLNTTCSLAAPTGLTATANGANQIDLSWSAVAGATRYAIYRSNRGAASCAAPMQQIGQSNTTTFSDLTVQGGHQYSYHVKALSPCDGPASNCATATATGTCTLKPTFAGITSATNAGTASCAINLAWSAATSNCPSSTTIRYNVYRSTSPAFTPAAGNRIASCVNTTSYVDNSGVLSGTTYYYALRAEDNTTGNGGPCGGGNEETNSVLAAATAFGNTTTLGTWSDGAETKAELIRGGSWSIVSTADDPAYVRTGTNAYKSSSGTSSYPANACADIRTPVLVVGTANPVVTFWARWELEFAFDGVVVEYSTNGGAAWTVVNAFTTGGYGGRTFTNAGNSCAYATTQGCYQATADPPPALPAFSQHTFTATAAVGANLVVRWRISADGAVQYRGFMLDDVSITNVNVPNACSSCTTPGVPTGVAASTPANNTIRVDWSAGAPAGATYKIYRSAGACPGGTFTQIASGVAALTYDDTSLAGGSAYSYKVSAVDASGLCESAQSSCVSGTATGGPGLYSRGRTVSARPENTASVTTMARWVYNTGAATLTPPGIGSVFAVSNDRVLHGLIGGAGGGGLWPAGWTPWSMNAPSQSRPPVPSLTIGASTKQVFVGAQDGNVYAIDGNSGAQIWRTAAPLGNMVQAAVNGIFTAYGGSVDLLIAPTRNSATANVVYGLSPQTGATAWLFNNGGGASGIGIIAGDPWIDYATINPAKNKVYFASRALAGGSSATLWCLDFTAGAANLCSEPGASWPVALGDIDSGPTLIGNRLYIGNNAGTVYCINATTGATIWSIATGDGPIKGFVSPDWTAAGLPMRLFIATSTKITAITDNGASASTAWTQNIAGPSVPLFDGSRLYVGSSDGRLYQLSGLAAPPSATSVLLGTGAFAVGSPSYDFGNGLIYVGTDSGKLFAIQVPLP